MTNDLDAWQEFQKKLQSKDEDRLETERDLKESIDLNFYFQESFIRLVPNNDPDRKLIRKYKLASLNDEKRDELKAKVRAAMASPQETGSYHLAIASNDETEALSFVQLEGLIVLGLLGDKKVVPNLLALLKRKSAEAMTRTRIVVGAVLRHLTGQDIGGYIPSNIDISLWERWWEQNKSTFLDED